MSEGALTIAAIVLGLGAVAIWTGLLSLVRDSFLLGLTRAQALLLMIGGVVAVLAACVRIFAAEAG